MNDITLTDLGLSPQPLKNIVTLFSIGIIITLLLYLTLYCCKAVGLYTMSRKCKLKNSFYAFIPFFGAYTLGDVAGAQSKNGKASKGLGGLNVFLSLLTFVLKIAFIISVFCGFIDLIFSADSVLEQGKTLPLSDILPIFGNLYLGFALLVSIGLLKIVQLICLFKIYLIFSRKFAFVLLFFSIFFGFTVPFFLISIRKNNPNGLEVNKLNNG